MIVTNHHSIHNHWLEPQQWATDRWCSWVNSPLSVCLVPGVRIRPLRLVSWAGTLLLYISPNWVGFHGDSEMSYGQLWVISVTPHCIGRAASHQRSACFDQAATSKPILQHGAIGLPPNGSGHGWKATTLDKDPSTEQNSYPIVGMFECTHVGCIWLSPKPKRAGYWRLSSLIIDHISQYQP